ncbi:hypothetical protein [Methylobacterium dankookense]|uniref:Uncharacterized protein n=1 Tax=Methylobacterium dankookense TaxID=560405 RepID=A0A564G807_9HYPH|nr:hypothetical protein [Methylobacterium dankookense]GJD55387.1 hypothetical protein IFDJLNFL_1272 [Methylobacterium dankookense]VUF15671.1 hypothetical protein MTDSW087_05415 [Methylobacterium dankookense]
MQQDTPAADDRARRIAENAYAAFCRVATMPAHPLAEQTVLARLAEAVRPQVEAGPDAIVAALNAALDAWEAQDPAIRGPRVASADPADGTVRLRVTP